MTGLYSCKLFLIAETDWVVDYNIIFFTSDHCLPIILIIIFQLI
jgi:hypothetical protein